MMTGKMMLPNGVKLGAVTKSWVQNHARFRHDFVIMILSRMGVGVSRRWPCRRAAGSPQTRRQEDWGQENDAFPASASFRIFSSFSAPLWVAAKRSKERRAASE
jgi:hypothetical protein